MIFLEPVSVLSPFLYKMIKKTVTMKESLGNETETVGTTTQLLQHSLKK